MSAQRRLVPSSEIKRVFALAFEHGLDVGAIEVGADYVRITPAANQGDDIAQWVNRASPSQEKAKRR